MKRSFEQRTQEYEQTTEAFLRQKETDIQKLSQEKDDLKHVLKKYTFNRRNQYLKKKE